MAETFYVLGHLRFGLATTCLPGEEPTESLSAAEAGAGTCEEAGFLSPRAGAVGDGGAGLPSAHSPCRGTTT